MTGKTAYYVVLKGEEELLGVDIGDEEADRLRRDLMDDLAEMDLPQCGEVMTRPATAEDVAQDDRSDR